MYFNFDNLKVRYSPYPIGIAKPLMDPALYSEMLTNYPAREHFMYKEKLGHKYTRSEHFNPKDFHRFVRSHPVWSAFYRWLRGSVLLVQAWLRDGPDAPTYRVPPADRRANLRALAATAERIGARLLFLVPGYRDRGAFAQGAGWGGMLREIARETGAGLVDIDAAVQAEVIRRQGAAPGASRADLFNDSSHLNAAGHAVAAAAILEALAPTAQSLEAPETLKTPEAPETPSTPETPESMAPHPSPEP